MDLKAPEFPPLTSWVTLKTDFISAASVSTLIRCNNNGFCVIGV